MNVLPVSSYRAEDCKCYSSIRDNTYNFVMECYYIKNGKRKFYRFESNRNLDLKNNTVLSGEYTVETKKI